ncbi:MAG: hypothetical protein HUK08_03895 [Bacteroidaceae bacterium]|nr:hypothetical protein [Bacteroidaceae bacterium]
MKRFSFLVIAVFLLLTACDKQDIEVNNDNIVGTWVENYDDYPDYTRDGFVTWVFDNSGHITCHVSDVFAGDHDVTRTYRLGALSGQGSNVITIDPDGDAARSYQITRLTKTEMEWQMVGTTFSPGSVGGYYKHFVKR